MPITVLDYVRTRVGDKDSYLAEDFYSNGVDMTGGCEICGATLCPWNAYPSTSGYWKCGECIADQGYNTVAEFETATGLVQDDCTVGLIGIGEIDEFGILCPSCGNAANVAEILEHFFMCGDCGSTWSA